jgi:hypothetical protein
VTRAVLAILCAMTLAVPSAEASWGRILGRTALKRALGGGAARGEVAAAAATRRTARQLGKQPADYVLRADRARDAATPAAALGRERVVQRYTSAAQAEKEAAGGIAPGSHMTSRSARGRPLSAEGAQGKYGLMEPPRESPHGPRAGEPARPAQQGAGRPAGRRRAYFPRALPPSAVVAVKPVQRAGATQAR